MESVINLPSTTWQTWGQIPGPKPCLMANMCLPCVTPIK